MNSHPLCLPVAAVLLSAIACPGGQASFECRAWMSGADKMRIAWPTQPGKSYHLLTSAAVSGPWGFFPDNPVALLAAGDAIYYEAPIGPGMQWFRVVLDPDRMALIPGGEFAMGDAWGDGEPHERPVHSVRVSAFFMDRTEVTHALWVEVAQWGAAHGYQFDGSGWAKASNHPATMVSWHDAVKWCNARSEMEGRAWAYYTDRSLSQPYRAGSVDLANNCVQWDAGYHLPTEAEWERAAQGGAPGRRFPWGQTITHSHANYYSSASYEYDTSPTRGYHPAWGIGALPHTSPVGSFPPNRYGLFDMAGNVREWCWDRFAGDYYAASPQIDPRGPAAGEHRVPRGGNWNGNAVNCRVARRTPDFWPDHQSSFVGFRTVLPCGLAVR